MCLPSVCAVIDSLDQIAIAFENGSRDDSLWTLVSLLQQLMWLSTEMWKHIHLFEPDTRS